jgi:hypothetical protein
MVGKNPILKFHENPFSELRLFYTGMRPAIAKLISALIKFLSIGQGSLLFSTCIMRRQDFLVICERNSNKGRVLPKADVFL